MISKASESMVSERLLRPPILNLSKDASVLVMWYERTGSGRQDFVKARVTLLK